jgi:HEAT repeat protein
LAGRPQALPVLLDLTHVEQSWLRRVAGRSLGHPQTCGPDSLAALVALLDDPDPDVRAAAVEALYNLGPSARAASPALRRLLNDTASTSGEGRPSFAIAPIVRDTLLEINPAGPGRTTSEGRK